MILVLPLSVRPSEFRRISCHLNYVYILSHSQIILWDLVGIVLQMRNRVLDFSSLTKESIKCQKRPYWWIDVTGNLSSFHVTGNLSSFQRVDKWYSRIWLGMSCRCAISCRKFQFIPRGQMRVGKRRFLFSGKFITCTTSTFSGVDNSYSKIGLSMSCRWAL